MAEKPQDKQWQDWAAAAQGGNKQAYRRLLSALGPYIRNLVAPSLANPDGAEEIMQETLLSVHKSLKTYDPAKPFKPWLLAIVNFRKTDYLRKHYTARQNSKTSLEDPDFLREHVTRPDYAGEWKDMKEALATLPRRQRHIFCLTKIKGYTAQEVAIMLNMNISAVKVSAHRSARKLRELLG